MDKSHYIVLLRSIILNLGEPLNNIRYLYFDPYLFLENFETFATIRSYLKQNQPDVFNVLKDRELPIPTESTSNDGRGYLKRKDIQQLFNDCKITLELLEHLSLKNLNSFNSDKKIKSENLQEGNEIFISHAFKDKALVKHFVDNILKLGLEIQTKHIFCTSLEGMDIKNGEDFRNSIRSALEKSKIIILIITQNYKNSEVCLNEMGVAWYVGKKVIPLIVDPINYSSVGVLLQPLQIPRINDNFALGKLKDDIIIELGVGFSKTNLWESYRASFIDGLPKVIEKMEFVVKKTDEDINRIELENKKLKAEALKFTQMLYTLQNKYDNLSKEKGEHSVKKIEDKFSDQDSLKKFKKLTQVVKTELTPFSRIIKAMIICDYYKLDYTLPIGYLNDLEEGVRKKQIYDDGDTYKVKNDNNDVRKVYHALNELADYVENTEELSMIYEETLELDNQDFWDVHYGLKVPS